MIILWIKVKNFLVILEGEQIQNKISNVNGNYVSDINDNYNSEYNIFLIQLRN